MIAHQDEGFVPDTLVNKLIGGVRKYMLIFVLPDPFNRMFWIAPVRHIMLAVAGYHTLLAPILARFLLLQTLAHIDHHGPPFPLG